MKKIVIIQARMGSSRLPGKVLMDLQGRPVLSWVVDAAKAINHIDRVIVATSDKSQDDAVEAWCKDNDVDVFRGDEHNVLRRYFGAAQSYNLRADDIVMRLTADCPLLDPQVCGEVLSLLVRTGKDYANNIGDPRSWPDGLDCEVFRYGALERSVKEADDDLYKEHVTLYIRRNPELFQAITHSCPIGGLGDYRWTLDTKDDWQHIQHLMQGLQEMRGENCASYAYSDVLAVEEREHATVLGNGKGLEQSQEHLKRALQTIPSASQTFSKSYIQHSKGVAPFFLDHGKGAYVWDVDGNQYIDYLAALLPVLLGYDDDDVNEAIKCQLAKGISFSLATTLEAELSEMLVEMIPSAEMVRLAKNGSDVTAAAIRLARAYTGRSQIAICGYHSWHDWYIGTTAKNLGVPQETKNLADTFSFNDIDSLKSLLSEKKYAAIILEAEGQLRSENNFLEDVRTLATEHGAVLVFDEIVSGFRSSLGGIQEVRGVVPDLSCFGKAMGNGMPISAIVGRKDIMMVMDDIFFSGTFGGEALSIAAAIACLKKYKRIGGVETINTFGAALKTEINGLLAGHGLGEVVQLGGEDWWPIMHVLHDEQATIKSLARQELARNGIIQGSSINLSTSHCTPLIMEQTLMVWDKVAVTLGQAVESGKLAQFLADADAGAGFKVRT